MYWTIRFSLYSDCRHAIEARTIEHAPPVLSPLVELASSVRLLPRVKTPQSAYLLRWALQGGSPSFVFVAAGLTFGINICYDTAFPETAAPLARQGADLIVCPANNMMGYEQGRGTQGTSQRRTRQAMPRNGHVARFVRRHRCKGGPYLLRPDGIGRWPGARPSSCRRPRRRGCPAVGRGRALGTARSPRRSASDGDGGRRRHATISKRESRTPSSGTRRFIGDGLRARTPGGRAVEALLACNILNATMRATRRKGGPPRTTPRLGRFSSSVPTRRSRRRSRIHEHGTQLR